MRRIQLTEEGGLWNLNQKVDNKEKSKNPTVLYCLNAVIF